MMKKLMAILSFLFLGIGLIYAQTVTITGTVVDDVGVEVIGASIVVKGTTTGVSTDVDGKFTLNAPANSTLVVRFIGMKTIELKAAPVMNIVLEYDARVLEQVEVTVPYGSVKKESYTGSASVVTAKTIEKRIVANVSKALDGVATGVMSTSGSGQPGEGATVRIRGYGSINASSSPLYVVDGVPYSGSIGAILPSDIESMSILKDATAGALYGSRGANGVIMITTKRGKEGRTQVNVKASWGWASRAIPEFETVNEAGYLEAVFQSFKNQNIKSGMSPRDAGIAALGNISSPVNKITGLREQYNPYNYPIAELLDPVTGKVRSDAVLLYSENWLDEVSADSPFRQEYVVSVNGGNQTSSYLLSAGYVNEEGLLKTTKFERFSTRLNVDTQAKEWLKLTGGVNLSLLKTNNSIDPAGTYNSNPFYAARLIAPIYPVYEKDANGETIYNETTGQKVFDYGMNRASGATPNYNTIATLYDDDRNRSSDEISTRLGAVLGNLKNGPLQGIALSVNLGADLRNGKSMVYANPYIGDATDVKGRIQRSDNRMMQFTFNQLLTWKRKFGVHSIDLLLGHEFMSYKYNYMYGHKTGFPFGGLNELNAAVNTVDLESYQDRYRVESMISNLNYNYDDRYYLSASIRRDGSSRFHTDDRWGTFWSVGGNWRVSAEEFMKDVNWVNNLSVKASYGQLGNDDVLDSDGYSVYYAWQSLYDMMPNGSYSGAVISSLENRMLTWEKQGMMNFGIEARLFNRLSVEAEYYSKKTTNMLLDYPMATSTGFSGYSRNSGEMRNSGLELTLTGEIIKTEDFDWSMTFMASTLKNKILKLVEGDRDIISGSSILRKGEDRYSFYTAVSAGVDPATGDPLYQTWETDEEGNKTNFGFTNDAVKAGNYKTITGKPTPDLFGSINTQFRYKDFDLGIMCGYSIGGKVYNSVYMTLMQNSYVGQTRHVNLIERAWREPGDITDVPKIDFSRRAITTDQDLINASYFSLKNITLGYSLPQSVLNKIDLKGVRLNVTADNLYMFTHLKGLNPQTAISGRGSFAYNPTRTISFGVDIQF